MERAEGTRSDARTRSSEIDLGVRRHREAVRTGFVEAFPLVDPGPLIEWRRLAADAPPFLAPEFFLATARWLDSGTPLLAGARVGDELSAVLPLRKRGPELTSLTSDQSPRFDLVGERASIPFLWRALCKTRGWHVLTLQRIPVGSPLALDLIELAREDNCRVAIDPASQSPYFELERFEEALSGRFRRNLRSRARKLRDLRIERISRYDEGALATAFDLEAAGWKGSAGTAIACHRNLRGFYREIALHFGHRGGLALTFLVAGGERIAMHFALEDKGAYYLFKPGYDPSTSRYGPGHLLIERVAADARHRGLREFEFLGKDLDWKREWTDRVRRHISVRIYRPTSIGRVLHTAERRARPAAGKLLRQFGLPRRRGEEG